MVSFSVRGVAFTAPAGTGTQTYTVASGPGLSPKAAIVILSGAVTLDTIAGHGRLGIGITDGTNSRVISYLCETGSTTATTDSDFIIDNASVVNFPLTTSNAVDTVAAWSAWVTDGITLNWTDAPATRLLGYIILFFGNDLEAGVRELAGSASIGGTASISDLGFMPDVLIGIAGWGAFTPAAGNQARMGLGFAVREMYGHGIQQTTHSFHASDRAAPSACREVIRDDCIIAKLLATDGARLEVTSFESGGWTMATRDVAEQVTVSALALKIGNTRAFASIPTLVTSSTGNKPVTGVGFKPQATFAIASVLESKNTPRSVEDVGDWSIGITDANETLSAGTSFEDGIVGTNTDNRSICSSAKFLDVMDDAGTFQYQATGVSADPDGFTVNIGDASSADKLIAILCFGENRPNSQFLRPFRERHRQQLARM